MGWTNWDLSKKYIYIYIYTPCTMEMMWTNRPVWWVSNVFFIFIPIPGENDENGRAYFLKWVGEQPPTRSDLNFRKPRERMIGVSLMVLSPKHTPKWSFLIGKPMVVGCHHFRKPPTIGCIFSNSTEQCIFCRSKTNRWKNNHVKTKRGCTKRRTPWN